MKGIARGLVLKPRLEASPKWRIAFCFLVMNLFFLKLESVKDLVSFLMVDIFFPAAISWKYEMDRLADF